MPNSKCWIAAAVGLLFGFGPSVATEWATKEEAIAIVKRAVVFIKDQGPDKAYAEITNKAGQFRDRDLYITVVLSENSIRHRFAS